MKNNKGFSLVELIIVIAIMAILVGVMAPQLIKYIEKSNVSADTQLAASVQTACVTAMMDPEVLADSSGSSQITALQNGAAHPLSDFMESNATNKYNSAVMEILGDTTSSAVEGSLKSANCGGGNKAISVTLGTNNCSVVIHNTDSTGSKGSRPAGGTAFSATDYIGVY